MSKHCDVFPAATVDALKAQLATAPEGTMLTVYREHGSLYLRLVAATGTGAASANAAPALHFEPLNDSFVCPGDPRCPK